MGFRKRENIFLNAFFLLLKTQQSGCLRKKNTKHNSFLSSLKLIKKPFNFIVMWFPSNISHQRSSFTRQKRKKSWERVEKISKRTKKAIKIKVAEIKSKRRYRFFRMVSYLLIDYLFLCLVTEKLLFHNRLAQIGTCWWQNVCSLWLLENNVEK